ncbi:MAG: phenylalanine--tRNA ligase subunit beta [Candidatus Desulfofervidaceae bacterium]|nr:phenylalanine--tRNA ligase subunit beta [Candidatus Desulfofervidaceae bacterium]MDL1970508.1 phenylalanine--tRNA ligase subunit beta [Candidatus Desulfofervidaceae bacterium]
MRVPLNWLREFVDVTCSAAELAEMLTMAGLEVEEIEEPFSYLKRVIVARINAIKPHPNADRLKICVVTTGEQTYEIVCGAPNIQEGTLVPLALPGCELPSGIVVKEAKIRGIKSPGMLCSQKELGLGEDHSGIWLLTKEFNIGKTLAEALNLDDTVLEVAITPNRGDCLSILGVAREVAAITRQKIHYPTFTLKEAGEPVFKHFRVTVKHREHCYRYIVRLIRGVRIQPSPWWLQAKLLLAGVRPINNIVDITNYVMLEYGQPLHAFDAAKIAEGHIIVRLAHAGEKLITLDGKEHSLHDTDLLICDPRGPIALAGVMGGLNSEITPETKDVLLESAYFNPITIRRTAKRLNISTESSYRFEREVDPEGTFQAAQRACYFMQSLAEGTVAPGMIDEYPEPQHPVAIYVRIPRVQQLLGMEIEKDQIIDILQSLQIEVKEVEDKLEVTPPSFRHDLTREIDFIEEVARLYGYEKIAASAPLLPLQARALPSRQNWRTRIKDILSGLGWHEVITYAFIDPKSFDKLGLPSEHPFRQVTKLLNPLTADRAVMRSTLVPGLLEVCSYNHHQRIYHLRVFEVGKVFRQIPDAVLPEESYKLGGVLSGYHFDFSWHFRPEQADFYDIKGVIDALLQALGINEVNYEFQNDIPYLNPTNSAYIIKGDKCLGYLGEIQSEVKEAWDLKRSAFLFELDLESIFDLIPKQRQFKPLPKFPPTERDVALVVPEAFAAQAVENFVTTLAIPYLESIEIIDVYQGAPIEAGKKSLTYRLTYRAPDRTLTDAEVDKLHGHIVGKILKNFKIEVRQ